MKNRNGSAVFTSPNVKKMYSLHALTYAKNGKNLSIQGKLLFFDITARALNKGDCIKLNSRKEKISVEPKTFYSRIRKAALFGLFQIQDLSNRTIVDLLSNCRKWIATFSVELPSSQIGKVYKSEKITLLRGIEIN
jgi:hypothetical protein